ncbi:spondin domain-containing protein [Litoreibacter roseus]|uniref:Spondin domain-containing protein n=1 Tax=Litoreibacter roseus TaxID=2601869 RepID=A0A6N6JJR2_9RHOB|nr:spondin domain-containing protein [Litoreibacter roseus]GFE66295.1 hypothetical protein KIN_33690 [Litoreibacter roseus]
MTFFKTTALVCASFCVAGVASATTLSITVTNNQAEGGLSLTPLYTAIHDGTFDAFTVGEAASDGVRLIAETGAPSAVRDERLAMDPDSSSVVLASPDGPPPVQPGETITATLDIVANEALFFTFLSMVLPSNDTFIGNDNPLAYQLFDDSGAFLGAQTIEITGNDIYDAGTEVNGLEGAAFVQGQDIALGEDEGGVVTAGGDLSVFAGQTLATGDILGDAAQIDFFSDPASFSLATITISEVAPIPLPASGLLLLAGMGGIAALRRKQR